MTTQIAASNISKNRFGNGAVVSVNVSNGSKKGKEKKKKTQTIALEFLDSDSDIDSDNEKQMPLTKWLSALHLDNIYNKLKELGVEETEDMTLLDEEDFESLNLKKIQMKKLRRAIAKIE